MPTIQRTFSQFVATVVIPFEDGDAIPARVRYARDADYPLTLDIPVGNEGTCDALLERLCSVGSAAPVAGAETRDVSPDLLTLFLAAVDDPKDDAHREACREARESLQSRSDELSGVVAEVFRLRQQAAHSARMETVAREETTAVRDLLVQADANALRARTEHRDAMARLRETVEADVAQQREELARLRAEHADLQDVHSRMTADLTRTIDTHKSEVERLHTLLAEREHENAVQVEELDALRARLADAVEKGNRVTNADEAVKTSMDRVKLAELQRAQAQKDLADVQGILSADRLKHAEELKASAAEASRLRDQLRGAGVALQSAADTAAEKVAAEREARTLAEDTVAALRRELADTIAARAVAESDLARTVKERDDLALALQDRLRAAELDLRDAARFDAPATVPTVTPAPVEPPRGPDLTVMRDPTDEEEAARLARHAALSSGRAGTPAVAWGAWSYETAPRTGKLCSVCRSPQVQSPGGDICENGHGGAPGVDPQAPTVDTPTVAQDSPLTPTAEVPGAEPLRGLPDALSKAEADAMASARYFKDIIAALKQARPAWTRDDITAWVLRHREEYPVLRRLPADMVPARVANLAESYGIG